MSEEMPQGNPMRLTKSGTVGVPGEVEVEEIEVKVMRDGMTEFYLHIYEHLMNQIRVNNELDFESAFLSAAYSVIIDGDEETMQALVHYPLAKSGGEFEILKLWLKEVVLALESYGFVSLDVEGIKFPLKLHPSFIALKKFAEGEKEPQVKWEDGISFTSGGDENEWGKEDG